MPRKAMALKPRKRCLCLSQRYQAARAVRLGARARQDERRGAQALLDRAVNLARHGLPPGRLVAELADELPARALLERSAGAEMLVLGTRRPPVQPGQPPLTLGPVGRICLRRAPCPVVMVAPDDLPGQQDAGPETRTLATAGVRPCLS